MITVTEPVLVPYWIEAVWGVRLTSWQRLWIMINQLRRSHA